LAIDPQQLDSGGAQWLVAIESAPDVLALHAELDRIMGTFGVEMYRYHVVADGLRSFGFLESLRLSTYPVEWMQTYALSGYFDLDPMIEFAGNATRPFRWFSVAEMRDLSSAQLAYLDQMRAAGFTDGWGIPVYGPAQIVGYFGVGTMNGAMDFTEAELLALQAVCERAHMRMFSLSIERRPGPSLSPRETEILEWIALGKSNDVIGSILGISTHTVGTHVRRIFAKLQTTNRTEAVIQGFQAGLLTLDRYREMRKSI
jgi:DNA-binding CsgD family transcriptional regulator